MTTEEVWDHWLELDIDDSDRGFSYVLGHPPTCLCIYHWSPNPGDGGIYAIAPHVSLHHPRCVTEYEDVNVGLFDAGWRGGWLSLWVEDFPGGEDAVMLLCRQHAEAQTAMPIYVTATYGWTPSTPYGGSEYEFEFSWRPQTAAEILNRLH